VNHPTASQERAIAEALRTVRDELRAGRSLRSAVLSAATPTGSPFAGLHAPLSAGRPLAPLLRHAGLRTASAEVACALCVLAVQSDAGGDPTPAVFALEERIRARMQAARHARALTASARMSARAMIFLTPGFLGLLLLLDPAGTWRSLSLPVTRVALAGGVMLQLLGSAWISKLVRVNDGAKSRSRVASMPLLRVFSSIAGGRRHNVGDVSGEVADAAEVLALVLEAGLGPTRGLAEVVGAVRGTFGDALHECVRRVRAGAPALDALRRSVAPLGDDAARFASAFADSERLGVPLAGTLRLLADDVRDAAAARLEEDVRKASVRVLLPLGLLILPAFVLSCLVPLLVGGLGGISL
jgi:Flp pilus assembly protein TadB